MEDEVKYGVATSRQVHLQAYHQITIGLGFSRSLKVTVGDKIFPKDDTTYFLTPEQRESLLPQILALAQELYAELQERKAEEIAAREEIRHDDEF